MEPAVSIPAGQAVCAQCGAHFSPKVTGPALCDRCIGLATPEPVPSPLQQTRVAGYRLVRELGGGRFGTSWLAEDDLGGRAVVKLLRAEAADGAGVQRWVAESQRLSGELQHPHVARLLAAGVHVGDLLVLAYEHGGETTLADELRLRGRLQAARALELCAQIAEGLAACHRAGISHLDLKPANVGISRDEAGHERARLLDASTDALLAAAGAQENRPLPLSTAAYRAPEHVAGKPGPTSDLYSLGVLLFQLLTGRIPVSGATVDDLLRAHRDDVPLRLRDAGRRMDEGLEALVARLLSKRPGERPDSGDEVAVLLRTVPHGEFPLSIVPEEPVPPLVHHDVGEVTPAPPLDPDLERALLGEVTPAAPVPVLQRLRSLGWTRWLAGGIAAGVLAGLAFVGLHRPSAESGSAPLARVAASQAPEARPVAAAPAPRPSPAVQASLPAQPSAAPPSHARELDAARQRLWMGQPRVAEQLLRGLLDRGPLSRPDEARAFKLLGDASAKQAHKAAALQWYRKALASTDDALERARLERLLSPE